MYDTRERVWRHLNFFQYKAFIHAAMPRVTCPVHGVRTVPAPWARPGSGFTLLFEAWAVEMVRHLPVSTLAGQLDETDTRLWRFISHYVDEARGLEDHTGVEAIGVDGTSRKGRNCITVVAGLVEHDVTDVTPGRDSTTVERFAGDFMDHDGVPGRVRLVTCGMNRGFQKDIREHLPHVRRIIDKFHVARHANEAALSDLRLETKRGLTRQRLKTARACRMREVLQGICMDSRPPGHGSGYTACARG